MRPAVRYLLYVALGLLMAASIHVYSFLHTPITPVKPVQVEIIPGKGAWEIAQTLEQNGVISHAGTFMGIAAVMGKAKHLQAGSYVFEGTHAPLEIMEILFRGRTLRYRITIPEGYTLFQIADSVSTAGLMPRDKFLSGARNRASMDFFRISAPSMEGFLFPDTYYLAPHMTPLEIMAKMVGRLRSVYTPDMDQRAKELGMSKLQAITLASLIEKEASARSDKPLISSVFHNRLKKGMRLQSDPTVVYGIDGFTGRIGPDDLLRESPYNTYRQKGLPPGPICSPGLESIKAALWPARTDYLYFVARGDGTHSFSSSLQEHNRAISDSYRRRKNGGVH